MADKTVKPNDQDQTIHGIVIRSSVDSGSIIGITPPKQDKRFFLLGPKDIKGENRIEVFGEELPLFASTDIVVNQLLHCLDQMLKR
jgi:hypothetical protein